MTGSRTGGMSLRAGAAAVLLALVAACASCWPTLQAQAATDQEIAVTRAASGKLAMKVGSSYKLGAKAKSGKVRYKSSNPSVATVSKKGVVKARSTGRATLKVSANSKTAKVKVAVVKKSRFKKVKAISGKLAKAVVTPGETTRMTVSFKPGKASNKNLTFSSSDTRVAQASPDGTVNAVGPGTATITATSCNNGKAKATATVQVKELHTVSFDSRGGSDVGPVEVLDGALLEMPGDPVRDGHVFDGWYYEGLSTPFDFQRTRVSSSMVLYAKWRAPDYVGGDYDLGTLQDKISAGEVEAVFDDSGSLPRVVEGKFTDAKVGSEADAASVLNEASALFGGELYATPDEIEAASAGAADAGGEDPEERFFRYSPTVDGLDVVGSQIIISADASGNATGMHSSYDPSINGIDTEPAIGEDVACDAARDAMACILLGVDPYEAVNGSDDYDDWYDDDGDYDDDWYDDDDDDFDDDWYDDDGEEGVGIESASSAGDGGAADIEELARSLEVDLEAKLVIYSAGSANGEDAEDGGAALVWAVRPAHQTGRSATGATGAAGEGLLGDRSFADIDKTYYIYADDAAGEPGALMLMVDSQADAASRSATAEDLSGNKRTFNVDYVGNGRYEMRDLERKITTYEVTGYNYHLEFDFNWFVKEPALPGDVVAFASGDSLSRTAVSLHSNMAAAYDFYKDVLGRRSYSGNASTELEVSYNDQTTGANAYWSPTGQRFVFGSRGNYGAGLDVVGHEFTHAVICYVVGSGFDNGLIYYGESGALNESYADIMGSLVEGKTGSGRWLHGEDQAKANRSLANPKEYGQPDRYSDRVVTDGDNGGVHTNSGIFNHAAYKMMTDSRTSGVSQKKWARVFYHSLFRLPQDATFLDARYAVSAAAAKLGFTASELYAIDAAFDEVGIVEPDTIRIVMRWGSDPDDLDSHFVGPLSDGGRFHVYFEDMNAFEDYVVHTKVGDEVSTVYHVGRVADLNRDDTDSYGPEITTLHRMAAGDYYFFVHDYTTGDSADSQALAHSRAYVSVWRKGECIGGPYYVDPASHGTFWAVFKMRVSASGGVSVAEMNEYGSSSIVSGLLD